MLTLTQNSGIFSKPVIAITETSEAFFFTQIALAATYSKSSTEKLLVPTDLEVIFIGASLHFAPGVKLRRP
jgi:hypothetical protein